MKGVLVWLCHYPNCKTELNDIEFNTNRRFCNFHKKVRHAEREKKKHAKAYQKRRNPTHFNCVVCGETLPKFAHKYCGKNCLKYGLAMRRAGVKL